MKAAFGGDAARNERRQALANCDPTRTFSGSAVLYLTCLRAKLDRMLATPRFRQPFDDEMLKFDGVATNHAQKTIRVARHQVTFHHFWKAFARLLEALQHLLDLFFQGHLNEDAQARAELGGVKKGHAPGDNALSSSARTRARQGEGDKPTRSASATFVRLASSWISARIRMSVGSRAFFSRLCLRY